VKLTRPLERLLTAMLADPSAPRYGYDLMRATGLASGTLYPMLSRLQAQGLVAAAWEPVPAEEAALAGGAAGGTAGAGRDQGGGQRAAGAGRPPRKYYWLTGDGVQAARRELDRAQRESARGRPDSVRPAAGTTG
jgi:DNA-binding PadR family transcriptional regulator